MPACGVDSRSVRLGNHEQGHHEATTQYRAMDADLGSGELEHRRVRSDLHVLHLRDITLDLLISPPLDADENRVETTFVRPMNVVETGSRQLREAAVHLTAVLVARLRHELCTREHRLGHRDHELSREPGPVDGLSASAKSRHHQG